MPATEITLRAGGPAAPRLPRRALGRPREAPPPGAFLAALGGDPSETCRPRPRRAVLAAVGTALAAVGPAGNRAARALESGPWFSPRRGQRISSRGTAAAPPAGEPRPEAALGRPQAYSPPEGLPLPYPTILDNTEGAAAFADVLELLPEARPGQGRLLVLDVGAGRSAEPQRFLEAACGARRPAGCLVVAADPYNRGEEENLAAQRAVEAAGGADAVTSASVLNVVPDQESRAAHVRLLHRALRPGGIALIKVWAGSWPERGTGRPTVDAAGDTYQANAWASSFVPLVETVFGKGWVYADNNLNLVVAVRAP
ncbi:unnamed protein product [Prorocentrum cordatum]|uniref:Methyltransferase type 11 domain-containing protein n=1 Tax=Prorocentrum cordatum TaxID=2364126 RepID=A0ABN9QSR1_9DINO|nr:unnamed protein product [Polarella glacialis]